MKAAVVPEVHGKWQLKEVPIAKPEPDQVLSRCTQAVFDMLTLEKVIYFDPMQNFR